MSGEDTLSRDLTLEEFVRFRDYINDHAGIFLEEGKLDSLRISLLARATRLKSDSLDTYYRILQSDDAEFKELLNLVTVNETSFFRFPQQFEALRLAVLPEIIEAKREGSRSVRVWSAGCSTGEEPYSIAMTLADAGLEALGWRPQVFGSDVSTKALQIAQQARYPAKAFANVPSDVVERHLTRAGDGYRVAEVVRRLVTFGYHNLIKEPYPLALMGDWDVIFCRNVTIYFRAESTRRVISNFYRCLNDGGYLFLGHSETLAGLSEDFEPVEIQGVFLYRKPRSRRDQWWVDFNKVSGAAGHAGRADAIGAARGGRRGRAATIRSREGRGAAAIERQARDASARASEKTTSGPSAGELMAAAHQASTEGEPRRVLAAVERVFECDPNHTDAYLLAAYAHADLGDYDEALELCDRALSLNPLLPVARYILGIIHQRRGDLVKAVSELKKTIYIDSEFALAHLNLGNIYRSQRKWDLACREYENALRALYKNPEGEWSHFLGGFKADLLVKTCERSLLECQRASGAA